MDTITYISFFYSAMFLVVVTQNFLIATSKLFPGIEIGTIPKTGFLSIILEEDFVNNEVRVSNLKIPDI